MTNRTLAAWVRPVASVLAQGRQEVLALARTAPADVWDEPSEAEGWTCKDVLAHLAGGNDRLLQTILRSITAGEPLDPALFKIDTDAENKRGVEGRRDWSTEKLIAELETDGEEVQDLLSWLSEEDKDLRQEGFPVSLGDFMRIVEEERHDLLHLAQMRPALDRLTKRQTRD